MLKVLIADDDYNSRKCLAELIDWEELGYALVGEAHDGSEAYRLAVEFCPDVIVSDIKMPVLNGLELAKKLSEAVSNVTIIFISGYEDFDVARNSLKYNVADYILKPIDDDGIRALTDIVTRIKRERELNAHLNKLLTEKSVENEMLYYLKSGERQYFIDFFNDFGECSECDLNMFNAVCLRLISFLYDYIEANGIKPDPPVKDQLSVRKELEEIRTQNEALSFTREMYLHIPLFGEKVKKHRNLTVNEVIEMVKKNFSSGTFGIAEIADNFAMSPEYIGRMFKRIVGQSLTDYINDMRLEKAVKLLQESDMPVADISELVGYSGQNYFARLFKKKFNMPPSEYRAAFQGKEIE